MHGRVMCGGHGCFKSSLMQNGRTYKYTQGHNHTYQWAKISMQGVTHLSSGAMCLFVPFSFSVACAQTLTEHLLGPRLSCFSCISRPFQPTLILIFMSWSWRTYYYSHYWYYAFRGRKITLGLGEVVQKPGLSLLQSSDWSDLWFMQTTYSLR